ncbi:hypothetical protein J6590_091452 [Homalodisca vitripennis]|nr:hypothetical protein J6590_091452 [Homalodisca vitripennis]
MDTKWFGKGQELQLGRQTFTTHHRECPYHNITRIHYRSVTLSNPSLTPSLSIDTCVINKNFSSMREEI